MSDDYLKHNTSPHGQGVIDLATLKIIDIRDKLPKHKKKKWRRQKKITRIVIHCTQSDNQDPFKTARYHVGPNHISKTGCAGLTYHDFIRNDGVIFHCTDYFSRLWHVGGFWNSNSLAIVMAYPGGRDPPPQIQHNTLILLLVRLCLFTGLPPQKVYGHREAPNMWTLIGKGSRKFKKWCPGRVINLNKIRSSVALRLQRKLAADNLYKGRLDADFGRKSKAALAEYKRRLQFELTNG